MIKRNSLAVVINLLNSFPAVALLGPRQVGKTTLALEEIAADRNFIIYLGQDQYKVADNTEVISLGKFLDKLHR